MTVGLIAEGGQRRDAASCDPSEPDDTRAPVDFAVEKSGRSDILYNNAAAVHFA